MNAPPEVQSPAPSVADGSGAKAHRQAGTRKSSPTSPRPQELPGERAYRAYLVARARCLFVEAGALQADIELLACALKAGRISPTRAADHIARYETLLGEGVV